MSKLTEQHKQKIMNENNDETPCLFDPKLFENW